MSNKRYFIEFASKIEGIPCIIAVESLRNQFDEFEYDVLDRGGRLAPWLKNKVTDEIEDRLWDEAIDYAEGIQQ